MYAVFRTGGKQFRVEPGSKLRVPTLEAEEGTTVSFDQVLIASDGSAVSVGLPTVAGASVNAEVLRHGKDRKIIVFKFRRRQDSKTRRGHRQRFTRVRIESIEAE